VRNNPSKRLVLISFLTVLILNLYSQTFIEQTGITLQGVCLSSAAWGDYDNDGYLDILLAGFAGSEYISKVYHNNGGSSFTEEPGAVLTGVQNCSIAWGDYDNDDDLDILLTGQESGGGDISKIYLNNSDNTFTEQTGIILQGVSSGSVCWGDYNNDGYIDILLTGSGYSRIYRNNGNNTFSWQSSINLQGLYGSSAAWGDYDNDGDLDILLSGDGNSKIYRNNGDNTFTDQTGIYIQGLYGGSVAWGDYDNDGYLDLLLTGWTGSDWYTGIYRNNGNNSFSEQNSFELLNIDSGSGVWGDFDNDGYLDILLTGYGSSGPVTRIYHNDDGTGFSELPGETLTDVYTSSAIWGDYNNDGKLDILLTGDSGSGCVSEVYLNSTAVSNSAPAAPDGLSSSSNETSVTLQWNGVTGDATPSD
jgi:hypothetical protein